MKTFSNYLDEQAMSGKIHQLAEAMVQQNIQADVFLKTWYEKENPELALYLTEAGVWDGIRQGAGAAWTGVKNAAQQFGQGIQQGVQTYKHTANGPMAQYQNAVTSLTNFVSYIQKEPQLGKWSKVANNIDRILKQLKQMAPQIPDYQNGAWKSQVDPVAFGMSQGNAGSTPIPPQNFIPSVPQPNAGPAPVYP